MSHWARLVVCDDGRQRLGPPVFVANRFFDRLRGLLGREQLLRGAALWLQPCDGVHTFWMTRHIDVLFTDSAGQIMRIDRQVPPRSLRRVRRACSVLELAAGRAHELNLLVGHRLSYTAELSTRRPS